jgi:type IV pilus assembly protein PilY1
MSDTTNRNYLSRIKSSTCWSLLLSVLCAGTIHGQTVEDYSAVPPFGNTDANIPSGSRTTVSAVESSGLGAAYQTYYHESYTDMETGKSISWGGVLQAIFMDESGRLREDNGVKGKLEDASIDYVVDLFTDETVSPVRTRFRRFLQTGSGKDALLVPVGAADELDGLNTIWNARDVMANISQQDLLLQRPLDSVSGNFAADAGIKRFVFTYLDVPGLATTGKVDAGEVIDFVAEAFNPALNSHWRYLGLEDQGNAMSLINYIRGQDMVDWRTRLVDLPGDDTAEEKYWLLGDIVNSTPLVVNPPDARYDLDYGDATYKKFKAHYAHRRQMIYAGANDGMLHAFNGGVWHAETRSFQAEAYVAPDSSAQGQAHTLGAEMWGYVPMNLLPHLQWLKAVNYPHVYYVDGAPQSFDVNIFADDLTHPGGWGTILVTGMRFGGGDFALDLDADATFETTRTSAVIVMDITDPEKPPVLLAELTAPDLKFTTSVPAVIKSRRSDASGNFANPARNNWLLVLGSGPEDLATATSAEQRPTLVAWDLRAGNYINLATNLQTAATEPSGFYGSFAAVDHNNDYSDDVLYVGTVEGTEHAPAGRLKRIVLNASASAFGLSGGTAQSSTVLDVSRPIVARPRFVHDYKKRENWVLFGTGRAFTNHDYQSVAGQGIFGIREVEDFDTSALEVGDMVDTTNILVQADAFSGAPAVWDGEVNNDLFIDDVKLESFTDLFAFMDNKNGWYKRLQANNEDPSERVVNAALMVRSSAIFTSFMPDPDTSEHIGQSFIYALNYRTGTADATGLLGMDQQGILLDAVSGGATELAEPALNITQESDPLPDHEPDSQTVDAGSRTISLVVGNDAGIPEQLDLHTPASTTRRISWELLDIPFQVE